MPDLKRYNNKEMLRLVTCGSVDDGKSTLIGRLLYDSKNVPKDQLDAVNKDSKRFGTTGSEIDLALLVDGLHSEREQGITIDVAYRYFSTQKRKFIIADTPGHEQYTRNMATGASNADLALIIIDVKKGISLQTKRHIFIVSLLGIKNIIVVINKMDLVDYSQDRLEEAKNEFKKVISSMQNSDIAYDYLPISALKGDNVFNKSNNMPWYKGKTLIKLLDTIQIKNSEKIDGDLRFPVQYVIRPNQNFRGYAGTITSGTIRVGERIMVVSSRQVSKVKSIIFPSIDKLNQIDTANFEMAVTITLEDELDISRGDMIVGINSKIKVSDKLKAMIIWMNEQAMELSKTYIIKFTNLQTKGAFSLINYKQNIDTFQKETTNKLALNEIGECNLKLESNVLIDEYKKNQQTGSFLVVDRHTNETIGAGMVISSDDSINITNKPKSYLDVEIELNKFIIKNYPQWKCEDIS